jgi:hypothetical protein
MEFEIVTRQMLLLMIMVRVMMMVTMKVMVEVYVGKMDGESFRWRENDGCTVSGGRCKDPRYIQQKLMDDQLLTTQQIRMVGIEAMLTKPTEKTLLMKSIMVMVIPIQQMVKTAMKRIIPQKTKWQMKTTTMTADGGKNQTEGKLMTQHVQ